MFLQFSRLSRPFDTGDLLAGFVSKILPHPHKEVLFASDSNER
jgi:hypothetical protein